MAHINKKEKALKLRSEGYSYSQIKEKLDVSKSTLSNWLAKYPLSKERISQLRDWNPRRIENYRNTMNHKREQKLLLAMEKAKSDILKISNRDLFIAGFFLYWAEGGKTNRNSLALSNTDPSMLKVFISWLGLLGISKDELKIKIHLYKDMNESDKISFWQNELKVKRSQFMKSYIKDSKFSDFSYKKGFGHGTCNVIVHNTERTQYILMGVQYIAKVLTDKV